MRNEGGGNMEMRMANAAPILPPLEPGKKKINWCAEERMKNGMEWVQKLQRWNSDRGF